VSSVAARSSVFKRVCKIEESRVLDFGVGLAERRMQLALDKVSRWTTEHGFRVSPLKTVAMHFCPPP
ncbi:hypothetical protein Hamer_G000548, partial [Homarus americanus]